MASVRFDTAALAAFHDAMLAGEAPEPPGDAAWWPAIAANHRCNTAMWAQEDRARCPDLPDAQIVACKRRIDALNQQRHDAAERCDDALLAALRTTGVQPRGNARLHSETAGSIVDRLSILALKIHHMRAQSLRDDASPAHALACAARLERLVAQRQALLGCLDALWLEALDGSARWSAWRQFKMYNDAATNPWLHGRAAGERAAAQAAAAR